MGKTKFEITINEEGVSTEFVRCPDPTNAGVVAKITRVILELPKEVGWT